MAYDNSNQGVLFKNDDKREGKRDSDYRGSAEVGGVNYWLDAWINESKKDGRKFLSVKFKPKEQRAEKKSVAVPAGAAPAFDDDIPFDGVGRDTLDAQDFESAVQGYPFEKDWADIPF